MNDMKIADEMIRRRDAVDLVVDIIEQAEENNGIIIVDRPTGWASIRDYAQEVVDAIPTAAAKAIATINIDTDEVLERLEPIIKAKDKTIRRLQIAWIITVAVCIALSTLRHFGIIPR